MPTITWSKDKALVGLPCIFGRVCTTKLLCIGPMKTSRKVLAECGHCNLHGRHPGSALTTSDHQGSGCWNESRGSVPCLSEVACGERWLGDQWWVCAWQNLYDIYYVKCTHIPFGQGRRGFGCPGWRQTANWPSWMRLSPHPTEWPSSAMPTCRRVARWYGGIGQRLGVASGGWLGVSIWVKCSLT